MTRKPSTAASKKRESEQRKERELFSWHSPFPLGGESERAIFAFVTLVCCKHTELLGGRYILLGISRGLETKLAKHFGVDRSTICRDKEALLAEWRKNHICPGCGTMYSIPLKAPARLAKLGIDVGCSALGCSLKNSARA